MPYNGSDPPLETCAEGAFTLGPIIGTGSFGNVFLGTRTETGEEVAIKLESADDTKPSKLVSETQIYRLFSSLAGTKGIATMHWCGSQSCWNIMVLDLLGPSLDRLIHLCGDTFSVETVLMIGLQLVSCLEALHNKMYVHRDIKPQNFMVGLGEKQDQIYMIDFGLAKLYYKNGQHIENNITKGLVGTTRYMSINTHLGYEQSRRDDLEALGYMLVFFGKGELPWQGCKANSRTALYQKIGDIKSSTDVADVCAGLPAEFSGYLEYCRSLAFKQKPDYSHLRQFWLDALHAMDDRSEEFDWAEWNEKLYDVLLEEAVPQSPKMKGNLFDIGEITKSASKVGNSFVDGIHQEHDVRCDQCRPVKLEGTTVCGSGEKGGYRMYMCGLASTDS